MQDFQFRMPRQIVVGFGKSRTLAETVANLRLKRLLVVVDPNVKQAGLLDHILDDLQTHGAAVTVFDEIAREPTIAEIDAAIERLQAATAYDGVIGVGGGSVIDAAKLLAVSAGLDGSIKNYVGTNLIETPGAPMIMLPTTAGTGAEATPNAIVHDVAQECKKGIVSPYLIPDLVILDPELTLSLPARVTAETGLDAFTHAIECFICNKATPMSDLFAQDAVRLIAENLRPAAQSAGRNKDARYNMALASLYGGIAIANSGTGGVHALAYPLGGKYHISHGLSNAVLLPEVMAFNAPAVPEKFVRVAQLMGIDTAPLSRDQAVQAAIDAIRSLVADLGVQIATLPLSEQILADLAQSAMTVQRLLRNNPRPITAEDARGIYQRSLGEPSP